jgi:hypothetical protein
MFLLDKFVALIVTIVAAIYQRRQFNEAGIVVPFRLQIGCWWMAFVTTDYINMYRLKELGPFTAPTLYFIVCLFRYLQARLREYNRKRVITADDENSDSSFEDEENSDISSEDEDVITIKKIIANSH